MKKIITAVLVLLTSQLTIAQKENVLEKNKWPIEKAKEWYAKHQWITGANFIPSNAINQLEMWQESTFDAATIDRELGFAESIGFNTMRVYLHSLAYAADQKGYKNRVNRYLEIANKHGIKTIFVIFDDVWDANPKIGLQREPKPGTHNSGWMQDPGYPASKETKNFPELEKYVKDMLKTFANDDRILLWDLYNEPGNNNKVDESLPLLKAVFTWAREVNPSQPLSAGVWSWNFKNLNEFQINNSDIVTYHDYESPEWHTRVIQLLETNGRPLICTEYLARTRNSRFSNILPILKEHNIGAINWGLVDGKTNTIYAWDTPILSGEEPIEWFHDIFRKNGTPYRQDEVNLIKKLNNKQ